MRLMPFCIAFAFTFAPSAAFAQGSSSEDEPAEEAAEDEACPPPPRNFTVFAGADFAMGSVYGVDVLRSFGYVGVEVHYFSPLTFYALFRGGHTRFSFNGRLIEGLDADMELRSVFDGSVGGGLRYRLLDRDIVSLDASFEAEGVPWRVGLDVERMRLTTPQGEFGIRRYAMDHADFSMSWYRVAFATTLAMHFDWFHPELTVGIQRYEASIDVEIDDQATDLFRTLDHDPRAIGGRYRLDLVSPILAPGVGFTFADRFGLNAKALIMPTGGGAMYGADLRLTGSF